MTLDQTRVSGEFRLYHVHVGGFYSGVGAGGGATGTHPRRTRCIIAVITFAQMRRFMWRISDFFFLFAEEPPAQRKPAVIFHFFFVKFLAQFNGWKFAPTCGRMCSQRSQRENLVMDGDI